MTVPFSREGGRDVRYLPGRTMRVLAEVALDGVGYTDKMI
jgi:hypothetical protein